MRLVQIDTETGNKTILFEDPRYSFIQPALNADGSKLAFVLLKEDRACIALADMATKEYKIVNNTDYDLITDPSSPSFNKDGTLNFCSNDRGRLEVFTVTPNSDGTTFSYTPAVSDPIAALWAYKNDIGIFYTSYASTGNVIKIKPLEEWKNVPDFEGPSPAGEIMTFREFEDDYPDFDPYKEIAQVRKDNQLAETNNDNNSSEVDNKDEENQSENNSKKGENPDKKLFGKDKKEKEAVKHRSKEAIEKLEHLEPATNKLENEKPFLGKITPLLYSPFFDMLSYKNESYFGLGGFFAGQTARTQTKTGLVFIDAFYYPAIKNFTGEFFAELPVGTGSLDFLVSRNTAIVGITDSQANDELFTINNMALAGYSLPIYSRADMKNTKTLTYFLYAGGFFTQQDKKVFSLTDSIPFTKDISFHTGVDYSQNINLRHDNAIVFSLTNLLLGEYNFDIKKAFAGYEGELLLQASNGSSTHEISTVIRYTDFPSSTIPFLSRAHLNAQKENCNFPGKILLNYSYIMPGLFSGVMDVNIGIQTLASFGTNSDGTTAKTGKPLNFKLDQKAALNLELAMPLAVGQKITAGLSLLFDLADKNSSEPDFNFYISCKMNWLRF